MQVLRALAAYARALVCYAAPQDGMVLANVLREHMFSSAEAAMVQHTEERYTYPEVNTLSIAGAILKSRTKRLKQRARRSDKAAKKPGGAQRMGLQQAWPVQLQRVAREEFQEWDFDVFMWIAHLVYRDFLIECEYEVSEQIPAPPQVQNILNQCGGCIVAA